MHRNFRFALQTIACVGMLIFFFACKNNRKLVTINPEFSKYIEAYSSGILSRKSAIRIQLAGDVSTMHSLNETINEKLFSFSPSVEGKAYWIDNRTIEFKPAKDLEKNKLYEVSFNLGKVSQVPGKFKQFKFNVQTLAPSFQIEDNGLRSNGKDKMSLSGTITTADIEESSAVENILSASLAGSKTSISWQHNESNKTHAFIIDGITRTQNAGTLKLAWDGQSIQAAQADEKEITVPAIGDFKILSIRSIQEEEQYALVQFSDPLMNGQQLDGLITLSEQENISYTINGSEVKIYASNRLEGNYNLQVNEGIQNQWGERLTKSSTGNIFFENRLPSVKIHGRGNILPNSTGKLTLPFEATNLKAVDVCIIKIYENNVGRFLQSNDLGGENDLRRVAKPLVQATIKLDDDKSLNLHKKQKFSLDIDKYLRTEPGAIYRVHIGFRPEYSLYTCSEIKKSEQYDEYDDEDDAQNSLDDDEAFWQRYNDYYPYGYDWDQKDNPCNSGYYTKEKFASRNIIASNIGLMAKKGNDNSLMVIASNLITTEPLASTELTVLDYQQQIITKATSNSEGIAIMQLKRKPYLLIAKKGNEKGYLKLDDGSSLTLARFDVSGSEVRNGIKGFVFGERGVWRPGDSLFLGFIVEDREKKLPKDHPIEMELFSPRGQLYKRLVTTNNADGFNVFKTATDNAAPTGNWTCKVKIGGAVFEKKIKIETIIPNRLKIDLNFNGANALGKNSNTNATLTANWLFGATAQNLKARVDAQLYRKTTSFEKWKDFVFDNPTIGFNAQSKTIFDGTLNQEGKATINPQFDAGETAPGMLMANLLVKVFEPGGNFSIDNVSMPYHPYSNYAGVRSPDSKNRWGYLDLNKQQSFDIALVNTDGSAVSGNAIAEVQLYKIEWRWWWDNSGGLSNFTQDRENKLLKTTTVNVVNGKASFSHKFKDNEWGRYLILVKDQRSGHTTGEVFYMDDDSWQQRNTTDDASAASMLSFTTDKEKYVAGEEVKVTIPTAADGKAFISIENGSKVVKTFWIKTTKGQTKYSFKTDKNMCPNIYINVSLLQPHAQTVNDLPIRMYGIMPVAIEDKSTLLQPVISMKEAIQPEVYNTITVSEANKKNMSYVIALVDEGLLDLTRFKTPDPHGSFYAKEGLGVKSWDLYDYVIGAWGGELERILTIGGDAEAELAAKTRRANRFKPVVHFMGPFTSNGGNKSHSFKLPAYMGSVRAMVIAANNGAYGKAEKSVKVKKPLMLLASLPRIIGPGEEVKIPVTVFATEKNIKEATIRLQGNDYFETSAPQTISFASGGEQLIYFSAKVKYATGIGKIKITASSGNEKTIYDTEIDIRNPNPVITQSTEYVLQPGQSFNTALAQIGEPGTSKAYIETSSIPAIGLQKRLSYLMSYPHGCIEQTTSAVFPQLYLSQLMDLTDKQKADIERNIRAGIQKIQNFQQSDGGFNYWPAYGTSDEWGSNYAGHFLLEANVQGYNVSSNMLQSWKAYTRSKSLNWNVTSAPWYGTDLAQAYRLYLLALSKSPELGAMNRLKEFKFLSPEAKIRLAAAYYLAGQQNIALQLISNVSVNFAARPAPGISYGSDLRDQAMVLETYVLMNRNMESASLSKTIASKLSQENWYSTQTTAYSLLAIAKFCGNYKEGKKINISGKNGQENLTIQSEKVFNQTTVNWQSNKSNISITNKGQQMVYIKIINTGKPLAGDTVNAVGTNPALDMSVAYLNSAGNIIDPTNLKQGTDFIAKVTVRNTGARGVLNEMALTQVFPAGWEILNTRLYNSEGAFKSSASEYMDIRDDKVNHYFDIPAGETYTYYVQLNAAYAGRYYWPGVSCEAMYEKTISRSNKGKWVIIKE